MPVIPTGKIKLNEVYWAFTTMPGIWLVSINTIFFSFPLLPEQASILPGLEGNKDVCWGMAGAIPKAYSVVFPARLRVSFFFSLGPLFMEIKKGDLPSFGQMMVWTLGTFCSRRSVRSSQMTP